MPFIVHLSLASKILFSHYSLRLRETMAFFLAWQSLFDAVPLIHSQVMCAFGMSGQRGRLPPITEITCSKKHAITIMPSTVLCGQWCGVWKSYVFPDCRLFGEWRPPTQAFVSAAAQQVEGLTDADRSLGLRWLLSLAALFIGAAERKIWEPQASPLTQNTGESDWYGVDGKIKNLAFTLRLWQQRSHT